MAAILWVLCELYEGHSGRPGEGPRPGSCPGRVVYGLRTDVSSATVTSENARLIQQWGEAAGC